MPLRDYSKLGSIRSFELDGLFGGWPASVCQHINPLLPEHYMSGPHLERNENEVTVFHMLDVSDTRFRWNPFATMIWVTHRNLVSNAARQLFVKKCRKLLRQRHWLSVIQSLPAEGLLAEIYKDDSYRSLSQAIVTSRKAGRSFTSFPIPLTCGEPLPMLPLWLNESLTFDIDLEEPYERWCRVLEI